MHETTTLGLRDRKRIETRARLEKAAVELVLRDGLQHATIDAIAEAADVSSRTFFNYFDSKEDAVLGLPEVTFTPADVLEQALNSGTDDTIVNLIGVMVEIAGPVLEKRDMRDARAEILRLNPELFPQHLARLGRLSDDLAPVVRAIMAHDPRLTHLAEAESPLAEMILALCSAAVRTSAKEWMVAGSDAPVDTITTRAIQLTREVIEKLQ